MGLERKTSDAIVEWDTVLYRWPGGDRSFGPVSGSVPAGSWIGLIGPNGAGKSTLLRLTAGFLTPESGSVRIDGQPVHRLSAASRARLIASVPQVLNTQFDLTVAEVVHLGRLARRHWRDRWGFAGRFPDPEVGEALHQVGLWDLRDRPFASLSGGEAKRVLLASALVQQSPVLLLDEPTSHLDPGHARHFLNLVQQLVRHHQRTVIMAYHDLTTIGLYVDQVWVIHHGQVVLAGPPADILTHPRLTEIYQTDFLRLTHPRTNRPMLLFP